MRLKWPGSFETLSKVCNQIQREVCSYLWHHGNFRICFEDMSRFFDTFHSDATNRIKSLGIDVTAERSEGDDWDAAQIAEYLRPLCQEGRLQRVVIRGDPRVGELYPFTQYMECNVVARYLRNVELTPREVGRTILVEHCWYHEI